MNCPGSVRAIRGVPDPGSVYAAEGTAAHTVSEWCRTQDCSASMFRGTVLEVDDYTFVVGPSMIKSVDTFCDYVRPLPGLPFFEQRVSYEPWVPGGFGTLDDGRLTDGVCRVTDFKHGKGVRVYAVNNTQLMLYALGLYHRYGHLYDFERFILAVVQPRMNEHFDEWAISLRDLLHWAEHEAKPIAAIALQPNAPFKSGEWCQFCPIKRTCSTRLAEELGMPKRRFANVDVSKEFENLEDDEWLK